MVVASHSGGGNEKSGDFWGGMASMLVLLPSAIAFGVAIFAPFGPAYRASGAMAGMLGAIAIGLVTPLAGGTPRLISAPCAPAAAVLAAMAAGLFSPIDGTPGIAPEVIIPLLVATALITGIFQLVFGIIRGGRVMKYIPYPVVSGYLSGVGITIILKQLPNLFGLPSGVSLWRGLATPAEWSAAALTIGIATGGAMLLAGNLTKRIPAPIIGLAGGMIVYFIISVNSPGMRTLEGNRLVIGPISTTSGVGAAIVGSLTSLLSITLASFKTVIWYALTLAILLSIDTLKTCIILDAITRSRHDSNRELIGQGLGNITAALAGGVPGAGTMGATLVNLGSGGRTRLSGVFAGIFSLVTLLLLGNVIAWVPLPALAGILIVVGARMIDKQSFHLLKHSSTYLDFGVIATVICVALSVDLIAASGAGVGLSILLFLREQIRSTVIRRKSFGDRTFSRCKRLPNERALLETHGGQTAIYELQGSLFFGTTDRLLSELDADLKRCRYIILDMRRVQSVDFTAVHMLEQIESRLSERGGRLVFSDVPRSLPSGQDLQSYFADVGMAGRSSKSMATETLNDALEWAEAKTLEEHGSAAAGHGAPLELEEFELFSALDAASISALRACVVERIHDEGDSIFTDATADGDEIFLIRKGTVKIMLPLSGGKFRHLASLERRDFFGEVAFLEQSSRTAQAVAATKTFLYVLSRRAFDKIVNERPEMGKMVFLQLSLALAHRLRQADQQIRELEES